MTYPGDIITVTAKVKSQDGTRAVLLLETTNQKSEVTAAGTAEVELGA
jgi:acyl dehydratase